MKFSVASCLVLMAVSSQAQLIGHPMMGAVQAVPLTITSQYHAQDELGQARFGYAHPGQASTNMRDALGNQIGSYAYYNPEGQQVQVSYTADHRGFRVLSNNLPVAPAPVQDTPEVAQAKANHNAALIAAQANQQPTPVRAVAPAPVAAAPVAADPVAPAPVAAAPVAAAPVAAAPVAAALTQPAPSPVALPVPVQDTPEVAAAKREHAVQWLNAKAATDAANLRNMQVVPMNVGAPLGGSIIGAPLGSHLIGGQHVGVHPFAYSNLVGHPMAYNQPMNYLGYNMPYGVHPSSLVGHRILVA